VLGCTVGAGESPAALYVRPDAKGGMNRGGVSRRAGCGDRSGGRCVSPIHGFLPGAGHLLRPPR
jgi:hypothetical protein